MKTVSKFISIDIIFVQTALNQANTCVYSMYWVDTFKPILATSRVILKLNPFGILIRREILTGKPMVPCVLHNSKKSMLLISKENISIHMINDSLTRWLMATRPIHHNVTKRVGLDQIFVAPKLSQFWINLKQCWVAKHLAKHRKWCNTYSNKSIISKSTVTSIVC